MPEANDRTVTFVLTGPREGFTGFLGRYGFKDGELTVPESSKDKLKLILCRGYACNVKGEAPIWETSEEGGSVRVGTLPKPEKVVTTVDSGPVASTVVPPPEVKTEGGDGEGDGKSGEGDGKEIVNK